LQGKRDSSGIDWFSLEAIQHQSKPRTRISSEFSDDAFYKMVQRVVDYVEAEGHGWIPATLKDDRELGIWAKNRRSERNRGKLKKEREDALEKAGFIWKFGDKRTLS
jgi:hypothetical protein